MQDFSFPKPMPPVIQVDLVSFSPDPVFEDQEDSKVPSGKEGIPLKAKTIKSKPKKVKHIKADISLKTKPKNLKELMEKQRKKKEKPKPPEKKPEQKPEKKPEKPPEKEPEEKVDTQKELEKQAEDLNREKIAQALSRLQEKVKDQGRSKEGQAKGASAGKGRKASKPIDIYHQVIKFSIRQNWVYTEIFANMDQELEVVLLIKILASGEIRDIFYETRSGNRYLDESAKRAIMKINPLPPLPAGMRSYDLGLIFTPKGLK